MLCNQKLQSIFVAIGDWIFIECCGIIVAENLYIQAEGSENKWQKTVKSHSVT